MLERAHHSRIEDLAVVGEELTEEHLRLVSGASKKRQAGPVSRSDGTSTCAGLTYVHGTNGESSCEADGDLD